MIHRLYLCRYAALCSLRVVVHIIGEQGHEEREAADMSRAGLSTVESLGEHNSTINYRVKSSLCCYVWSIELIKKN